MGHKVFLLSRDFALSVSRIQNKMKLQVSLFLLFFFKHTTTYFHAYLLVLSHPGLHAILSNSKASWQHFISLNFHSYSDLHNSKKHKSSATPTQRRRLTSCAGSTECSYPFAVNWPAGRRRLRVDGRVIQVLCA